MEANLLRVVDTASVIDLRHFSRREKRKRRVGYPTHCQREEVVGNSWGYPVEIDFFL